MSADEFLEAMQRMHNVFTPDSSCTPPYRETTVTYDKGSGAVRWMIKKQPSFLRKLLHHLSWRRDDQSGVVRYIKSPDQYVNVLSMMGNWIVGAPVRELSFYLETLNYDLELTSLETAGWNLGKRTFTVKIVSVDKQSDSTTVTHTSTYGFGEGMLYELTTSTDESPVVLTRRSKYHITVTSDTDFDIFRLYSPCLREDHFNLAFPPFEVWWSNHTVYEGPFYASPVYYINYNTLKS